MLTLLIETDNVLAIRIKRDLEKNGFVVRHSPNEQQSHFLSNELSVDFVVLSFDQELEVLRNVVTEIRKQNQQCYIIGIGNKHISEIRSILLNGVDDYLQKTHLDELAIRMLLKKQRIPPPNQPLVFHHNDFTLHDEGSFLQYKNLQITLTNIERVILLELFRSNTTVKFASLIEKIWGELLFSSMDRLMKRVSILRKKILKDTKTPLIRTVKGVGYALH